MLAPSVVQLMVTLCSEVYVPAAGEKVGVAATGLEVPLAFMETLSIHKACALEVVLPEVTE